MPSAKDRLIFPLDVASIDEAQRWVRLLSGHVGLFKVGLELFVQAGPDIVRYIHRTGRARIFLDLKLHDIPATVSRAMARIAELDVAFATVHCGESPRMLEAAVAGGGGKVGVLGVTVLTSVSADDLRASGYPQACGDDLSLLVARRAAMAHGAGCAGVVCSGLEVEKVKQAHGLGFVAVTPGIRPQSTVVAGDDQRRVVTPAQAMSRGADYLVIGRPIRDARDPVAAAASAAAEIQSAWS